MSVAVSLISNPIKNIKVTGRDEIVQGMSGIVENMLIKDKSMDTPDHITEWFEAQDKKNYYAYLLGIGRILKTKDISLSELSSKLKLQIASVNSDYDKGISQVSDTVPDHPSGMGFSMERKDKLKESLGDDINEGFKTQYYELIQKTIRYDETIDKLHGRRDYLVFHMNSPDIGFDVITGEVIKQATRLYEQYKGMRYKTLRNLLFSMIRFIAYSPEIVQKSFILNTSITGPAGSGKTTLARLLAKWYNVLGILTSDIYLDNEDSAYREVGAPELIAQYIGQTAPKTLGVLYSSLEKTLFIDEAYSVAGCSFDNSGQLQPSPYGEEFVSVLLPFIANHQGIGSVIVAGYKNLMDKCFFSRNEGLPRRFPTRIDLPLYSTDELYSIFLKNVIDRKENNITDENKETQKLLRKDYKKGRQITYADMKLAFMMIHYDTSHYGIELLRKYLLLIEVRSKKPNSDSPLTKSATIIHHVLTCLMSTPLRRNIIRWYFYKNVFDFNQSNLSFFPAQAGEMGLIADYVNKSIDLKISEGMSDMTNKIVKTSITYKEECDLFNEYYKETRGIELEYYKNGTDEVCELKRTGYSNQDFVDKICNVLNNTVFPSSPPINARLSTENLRQAELRGLKVTSPNAKPRGGHRKIPLRLTRKNRKQRGGSLTNLPTLKGLYESLLDKGSGIKIISLMIQLYVKIATVAIPEILAIQEDRFPVNMTRNYVLVEQVTIDIYNKAPADKKINTNLFNSELTEYNKYINRLKNLQHPLFSTNPKYAVWEDLGIDI